MSTIRIYVRSTIARGLKGYFHDSFDSAATIDDNFVWGTKDHFDRVRVPFDCIATIDSADSAKLARFKARFQTKQGFWAKTNKAKAVRWAVEAVEDALGLRPTRKERDAAEKAAEKAEREARKAYKAVAYTGLSWPDAYDDDRPGAKEAKKAWRKAQRDLRIAQDM